MAEATFPQSILTERLELRCYGEADVAAVGELIESNKQHLLRNFPELSKGLSIPEEIRLFLSNCLEQWNDRKGYCYGVWTKTPEKLIGQVKVKNTRWEIPSAELSYFIGQSFLRRGYAIEAVAAVIETAFRDLGFNRLYVRIISSNIGSIRLAQKLGMQHEGVHRNEFRCGFGELHDVNYYSLTLNDYAMHVAGAGSATR